MHFSDDEIKKIIKFDIDASLSHLEMNDLLKKKTLENLSKLQNRSLINRFLEYEINIPIQSAIAFSIFFILFIGSVTLSNIGITQKDIAASQIQPIILESRR